MSKAKKPEKSKSFGELDAGGKMAFIGKVLVFFITFGFAFPTIFSD